MIKEQNITSLSRTANSILHICAMEGQRKKQESEKKCKKEGVLGGFKQEYKNCISKAKIHLHTGVKACLERNIKDCKDERCRTVVKHYIALFGQEAKKIRSQIREDTPVDKLKLAEQKLQQILFEMETKNVKDEIIKWFMDNPYPADDKVHALANKLGIDEHKFEGIIYALLSDFLSGGRSKDFKGSYNPEELKMGIDIEKEHIKNELIATKIAKDHLAEIPDYYTRLKKMEGKAGIKEHEEILSELFIQSSEIESIEMGQSRDMQILRLGIIAELDAANLYEKLASLANDTSVRETMLDVSQEEKVHAGEFETLLEDIDPEYAESTEEGEEEVEDMEEQASKSASLYAMKNLGSKAQAALASKQAAKAGSAVGNLASKVGGFFRK